MKSIKDIVKYSIKFEKQIKKICSPLKDHLDIPILTYYKIYNDGTLITFSNFIEQMEFYYHEKFYLSNPYLVSPELVKSGCVFTATTADSNYQKSIELSRNRFNLNNTFLVVQQRNCSCEGFLFGNSKTNYIENLFLIERFIKYFKNEADSILNQIAAEKFNLIDAKGQSFFERSSSLPLSNQASTHQFLKAINPLTKREQECLTLFLQGRSAQSSAAILGLSKRTVEHYFINILQKLGCTSKSELHERFYWE